MEAQKRCQCALELCTRHDCVNKSVLLQIFSSLKIVGKFLPQGLFDDSSTCETDQSLGFSEDQITEHGKTRCDPTGSGMGEQRHVKHTRFAMAFQGS